MPNWQMSRFGLATVRERYLDSAQGWYDDYGGVAKWTPLPSTRSVSFLLGHPSSRYGGTVDLKLSLHSAVRPETGVATALDFMLGLDGETPIVGLAACTKRWPNFGGLEDGRSEKCCMDHQFGKLTILGSGSYMIINYHYQCCMVTQKWQVILL